MEVTKQKNISKMLLGLKELPTTASASATAFITLLVFLN